MRGFRWITCLGTVLVLLLMPSGLESAQTPSFPQTLTVCPQGTPICQFTKIQEAIESASPNDIVLVRAGTYLENLFINKSLSLVATETGQARIQGAQPGDPTLTVKAQGDFQVILDGLTILGGPPAEGERTPCNERACPNGIVVDVEDSPSLLILSLIDVQVAQAQVNGLGCDSRQQFPGSAHVYVLRSRFTANRQVGMGWGCDFQETVIHLERTEFSNDYVGVDISADATVNVVDTRFIGNRGGLSFSLGRFRATVSNSWFQGNQGGVSFFPDGLERSSLDIRDSRFIGNGIGLDFGNGLLRTDAEDSIVAQIEDSVFFSNRQYGLRLFNPYRLFVQNNTIEENGSGVMITLSSNVLQLNRNVIRRNREWGVALLRPPCVEGAPVPRSPFLIQGENNEIRDNGKGNLCPVDYPWPPDFIKR